MKELLTRLFKRPTIREQIARDNSRELGKRRVQVGPADRELRRMFMEQNAHR